MNARSKLIVLGAGILAISSLTACQSTPQKADYAQHRGQDMRHHKGPKLSPEQRQQFEQKRTEHREFMTQVQKACDGKTNGQATQFTVADKTVTGQCNLVFVPERQSKMDRRGPYQNLQPKTNAQNVKPKSRGEVLTDAERAELVKQYDQRLAERQKIQLAHKNACAGKNANTATEIKIGEQSIKGQCKVKFQANDTTTVKS